MFVFKCTGGLAHRHMPSTVVMQVFGETRISANFGAGSFVKRPRLVFVLASAEQLHVLSSTDSRNPDRGR